MIKIHCPIYGEIQISEMANIIINTPEFQRLKHIKQNGLLYLKFPTMTHSRFEHSIGVYHLTGILLDKLKADNENLHFASTEFNDYIYLDNFIIDLIKIAGLCHDLGHGPFSHHFDNLVSGSKHNNKKHENRSIKILEQIIKKNSILTEKLNKSNIDFIKNIIVPINGNKSFVYQVIYNKINGIDIDKMDYMIRDAYYLSKCLDLSQDAIKKYYYAYTSYDKIHLPILNEIIESDISLNHNQISTMISNIITNITINNNGILDYPNEKINDIVKLFDTRFILHILFYRSVETNLINFMMNDILIYTNIYNEFVKSIENLDEFIYLTDDVILFKIDEFYNKTENTYIKKLINNFRNKNYFTLKNITLLESDLINSNDTIYKIEDPGNGSNIVIVKYFCDVVNNPWNLEIWNSRKAIKYIIEFNTNLF
jgi:HD superfamily phosphohydrolase